MTQSVTFPIVRGAEGLLTPKSGIDLVWSKFVYAFICPQGSRAMDRSFGSLLYSLLFNPEDALLIADITAEANRIQQTYVPEMTILKVDVVFNSTNVSITIYFSTADQTATKTVNVAKP